MLVGYPYLHEVDERTLCDDGACLNPSEEVAELVWEANHRQATMVSSLPNSLFKHADLIHGWKTNHGVGSSDPWIGEVNGRLVDESYHPDSTGHWNTALYLDAELHIADDLVGVAPSIERGWLEANLGGIARIGDTETFVINASTSRYLTPIPTAATYRCLVARGRRPVEVLPTDAARSIRRTEGVRACVDPNEVRSSIVESDNSGASWYVDSAAVRHDIPDSDTYWCYAARYRRITSGYVDADIVSLQPGSPVAPCLDPARFEGSIIRRDDGVSWVVAGGQRHHIPTYSVDICAQFVQNLPVGRKDLSGAHTSSIQEGPPHSCDLNNSILRAEDRPAPQPSYGYYESSRHWIQDPWTFDYYVRRGFGIVDIPTEEMILLLDDGGSEEPRLDPAAIPRDSIIRRSDGVSWVVDGSGVRHHIPFAQDDVCWRLIRGLTVSATSLAFSQANAFPEADAWPCIIGDRIVRSDDGASYLVDTANSRHWIPDVETYQVLAQSYSAVGPWASSEVAAIPEGPRVSYRIDPNSVKNSIICRDDNVCWAVDGAGIRHHIATHGDNVCWRWVNGWQVRRSGLNFEQANSLAEAEPWPCSLNGRIIATNEGASYYMEGNIRRWIQDPYDFACYANGRPVIRGMAMAEAQGLPEGAAMPLCVGPGQRLVSIRSTWSNRFVSAELGYGGADYGMLRARATSVGDWERFRLIGDCNSSCVIQSVANRRLVSAELGYQGAAWGELRARATGEGSWERFRFVGDCNSTCSIIALGNGRYVAGEFDYSGNGWAMLRARSTTWQGWESFQIAPA